MLEQKIEEIITPTIEDMGYECVRVIFFTKLGEKTLQIMLERENGDYVDVNDCEKASHAISALLDVEDIVPGQYNLEVSSTGIDRPLTRTKDYKRFIGSEVDMELKMAVPVEENLLRKFKCKIKAVEGDKITLIKYNNEFDVNFDDIRKAKLVVEI